MNLIKAFFWDCIKLLCRIMGNRGRVLFHYYSYLRLRGRKPHFNHPRDLSEWLFGEMHKQSFLRNSIYVDKVKVREYVKSKGLSHILLELYDCWENADDISFEDLPHQFALKTNNGCGGHFFCKDKTKVDIASVKKDLNKSLILKGFSFFLEPHYKAIQPLIYCEELIDTGTDAWPTDYKFTCVKGEVKDIFVATERETGHTKYITLDENWKVLNYTKKSYLPNNVPPKPKQLEKMLQIARILAEDFKFVRVDLYENGDKIYFGELTFSPWGGYMYSYTDEAIQILAKGLVNH